MNMETGYCSLANLTQWCGNSQSYRTLSDKSSEYLVNWNWTVYKVYGEQDKSGKQVKMSSSRLNVSILLLRHCKISEWHNSWQTYDKHMTNTPYLLKSWNILSIWNTANMCICSMYEHKIMNISVNCLFIQQKL